MSLADCPMTSESPSAAAALAGVRVLALLNGEELFGHERGNLEVFKALRSAGALVRVGVNRKSNGGDVRETLERLGFETFLVPFGCQWSKSFFRKRPRLVLECLANVVRSSRVLRAEIRRFEPTHLHLGNPLAYSYVAPALAWSRVPVVYRAGDAPPADSRPNLLIWKSCLRRAQAAVANSDYVRRTMLEALPAIADRTSLIYNKTPEVDGADWPQPAQDGMRHVVYVGQISEHKGVRVLLEAARELVGRYPDLVFDLVGGSVYSRPLEEQLQAELRSAGLQQRILMHGMVRDPRPYFAQAVLHVAPSLFEEPAANVVLEAKSQGVPSVVFPSGGLPELITDGVTGRVCREKTAAALIEAITGYLDQPDALARAGEAARWESEDRFSPERFQSAWVNVYLKAWRHA
jgi:glycosyltransferase involved in cell wall biosynthesis